MRELTAQEEMLIRKSLIDSGQPIDGPKEAWLHERAILQRRIKHQRRELRRLNANCRGMDILVRMWSLKMSDERKNCYRHASQIAETFWFGKRIARAVRRWC